MASTFTTTRTFCPTGLDPQQYRVTDVAEVAVAQGSCKVSITRYESVTRPADFAQVMVTLPRERFVRGRWTTVVTKHVRVATAERVAERIVAFIRENEECNVCGRRASDPFRVRTRGGKVRMGCRAAFHADAMASATEADREWHHHGPAGDRRLVTAA